MRSLYPNAGNIHIEGHSVLSQFNFAARHLGVVTQHNTLWDRLSCLDHLRLFARLRGVAPNDIEPLVHDTVEQMELGPYKHKLAMQLSGGMKRKLCVAVALIGDPKLVLLDEPSAGLDPVS
jgi:ABC-type multidrug transport system ATPase subunit